MSNPTISAEKRAILTIGACVDRLFLVSRLPFCLQTDQVLRERRMQYASAGFPITGSGTGSDRMDFSRLLDSLRASGAITIHSDAAGRRAGVRLTAPADAMVRRLIGEPTVFDAWEALEMLAAVDAHMGRVDSWPEHFAVGIEEWSGSEEDNDALRDFQRSLSPFLPLGWVQAYGDSDSTVRKFWLRLTDAGYAALTAGRPENHAAFVQYSEAADDVYQQAWDQYDRELADAEPERPSDLVIPPPANCGWGSVSFFMERRRDEATTVSE